MRNLDNYEDVIDSREIIERIEELELEAECAFEGEPENEGLELPDPFDHAHYLDEDDREELRVLRELAQQCEGYGDWEYGEALVRYSYWTDYCAQLIEECYEIPNEFPFYHLDWDAIAKDMEQDYMTVAFDGIDYLMRA